MGERESRRREQGQEWFEGWSCPTRHAIDASDMAAPACVCLPLHSTPHTAKESDRRVEL